MSKMLEPCPFCGEAIKHIGSWARSFDPPRLYHEWHHPAVQCYLNPHGGETPLFSASDDPKEQTLRLDAWNKRALRLSAVSETPVAWTNQSQLGFLKDEALATIPMAMWAKRGNAADVPLYANPVPSAQPQSAPTREDVIEHEKIVRQFFVDGVNRTRAEKSLDAILQSRCQAGIAK